MGSSPLPIAFQQGRERLRQPVLPLVRLLPLLFLTTPHKTISELLSELNEPIDLGAIQYATPGQSLRAYLPILLAFDDLKKEGFTPPFCVVTEDGEPVDAMEALELFIGQQVLTQELETINSLLCRPCGCTICCRGPDAEMAQEFFEIPLHDEEIETFSLPRVETAASRQHTAMEDPPLRRQGAAFFETGPALYHWRTGWSIILPRGSICPHLSTVGDCSIYPERPSVCRRPQLFAYLLETMGNEPEAAGTSPNQTYRCRNGLVAVWDCPYVRFLKEEVADYAAFCGLETFFKQNKS